MDRTLRLASTIAVALALGLGLLAVPASGGDAMTVSNGTGCCKQ